MGDYGAATENGLSHPPAGRAQSEGEMKGWKWLEYLKNLI
jgi:hypothetical protein